MDTGDTFFLFFDTLFSLFNEPVVRVCFSGLLAFALIRVVLTFVACILRSASISRINDTKDIDNLDDTDDVNDIDLDNIVDKYDDYRG